MRSRHILSALVVPFAVLARATLRPVILMDMDAGFDDMFALMFLIARGCAPALITVSSGMMTAREGSSMVRSLLEELGYSHVPVIAGASEPRPGGCRHDLTGEPEWGLEYQNKLRLMLRNWGVEASLLDENCVANRSAASCSPAASGVDVAADAIMSAARQASNVVLLALGPLTNVAHAFERHRVDLPHALSRMIIMGGAVRVAGNTFPEPLAEFNFRADCSAAATVFSKPLLVEVVLFDLETAGPHACPTTAIQSLLTLKNTTRVASLMRQMLTVHGDAASYDSVAAALVLDPQISIMKELSVTVDAMTGISRESPDFSVAGALRVQLVVQLERDAYINLLAAAMR